MWQHLLTRKSCLIDQNEKYLIFKNVENLGHILNGRPGSVGRPLFQETRQATEHLIFINIKKQTYIIVERLMVFPYNVSKLDYIRQFSYTSRLKSLGRKVMTLN